RPEWGEGRVESARPASAGGQKGQRLVVTFANHGRVTINTAIIALEPAGAAAPGSPGSAGGHGTAVSSGSTSGGGERSASGGWLGSLGDRGPIERLAALPEKVDDPFVSLSQKISATMDLFRFEHSARGMIDWAVAATGQTDPLQVYDRAQLEQGFAAFERNRDAHLAQLLSDAWRKGFDETLAAVKRHRVPTAVEAAEKVMKQMR
ncbi:MAG: DUF3553 domain-containing protein, partial [Desulfobacterales bacterium]|nr:DUF3553 domain-containing protein [Desulfobacterales bacterium]